MKVCTYEVLALNFSFVMRGKQLNAFEKGQADAWSAEGVSHREIARRLKCHHATIGRFLKRFKATGDFKQLKERELKRKTSARDDRFIERQVLKHRRISSGKGRFCFHAPIGPWRTFEGQNQTFSTHKAFIFRQYRQRSIFDLFHWLPHELQNQHRLPPDTTAVSNDTAK